MILESTLGTAKCPRMIRAKDGAAVDLSEYWEGASDAHPLGAGTWNGGFKPRPELADKLLPAIEGAASNWGSQSLRECTIGLRAFFRFLDAYEAHFSVICELQDINEAIGWLWLHPVDNSWMAAKSNYFAVIGQVLRRAHSLAFGNDARFSWPTLPDSRPIDNKDVVTHQQARAALTVLKRLAQAIFARWRQADFLAEQGRNLLEIPYNPKRGFGFQVTAADLHATYRAIINRTGVALPDYTDIRRAMGLAPGARLPGFWEGSGHDLTEIQNGLYPNLDDLHCLSQLVMARTGWNPETVYSLDISNRDWATPHGDPAHDLWLIESWKERAGEWQQTICRGKTTTAPFHIIRTLIVRTEPLRRWIKVIPSRLTASKNAEKVVNSPWLAAGLLSHFGLVTHLRKDSIRSAVYWREQIRRHNDETVERNIRVDSANALIIAANANLAMNDQKPLIKHFALIPESMTPSDWRDIYADFVFVESRYSWVMVQWALGHKHLLSTRHYLRTKLWRRFTEAKLLDFQTVLLEEIRHARLDVVVLRAKVDLDVNPSEEDRQRLELHRKTAVIHERDLTICGYLCQTPFAPPPEIDPGNPNDGTTRCRRGERCPGCPAAIAVDIHHMVKRQVELELIRGNVSILIWTESQLAADLDVLKNDLAQWPKEEVGAHHAFWSEEFRSGRRRLNPWSGLN